MSSVAADLFDLSSRPFPLASDAPVAGGGVGELLRHPGIWRRSAPVTNARALASGWRELDSVLPGGGWPLGALSEILIENDGLGELGLVMPALAALTQRRRRVAFVAPPYVPYAPALAAQGIDLNYVTQIDAEGPDSTWSAEQCLRSGACGAVLLWAKSPDYTQLRRWQLAAESGGALGFLFRGDGAAHQASPAALRVLLRAEGESTGIEILKCRGGFDNRANTRFRWRA